MSDTLGQAILSRRQELGLSQRELAERANVSRGWVALLETGQITEPSLDRMARVAMALGLSVVDFVGETNRQNVILRRQITEARRLATQLLETLAQIDPEVEAERADFFARRARVEQDIMLRHLGIHIEDPQAVEMMLDANVAMREVDKDRPWLPSVVMSVAEQPSTEEVLAKMQAWREREWESRKEHNREQGRELAACR